MLLSTQTKYDSDLIALKECIKYSSLSKDELLDMIDNVLFEKDYQILEAQEIYENLKDIAEELDSWIQNNTSKDIYNKEIKQEILKGKTI